MISNRYLIILAIILSIPAGCYGLEIPPDLQIITENYPPLNYIENGTLQGISVDLMELAFERLDIPVNRSSFQVLLWSEGYTRALNTPNTVIFSTARLPERESQYLWAGPLVSDLKVLFSHALAHPVDKNDISGLRIVAITNDSGIGYAIEAGADREKIILVPTPEEAVHMIENGTADAWSYGKMAGIRAIDTYADDPNMIVIGAEIGTIDDYVAFNLNTSAEFVDAIHSTLKELKQDRSETGISAYEQIYIRYLPVGCTVESVSVKGVINLVSNTAVAIESDATGTIADINAGKAPYIYPDCQDVYVFVYDTKGTLIANADNPGLVGKNFSGLIDVTGKKFRDEMIAGALKDGSGSIDYVHSDSETSGLYQKRSYYELVTGSDGVVYVVGAGRYLSCDEMDE